LGLGALRRFLACCCAVALLAAAAARADDPAAQRVEARSTNLLAVGIVQGGRMSIHLSRPLDNAPVRDAVVAVLIRGVLHPTVAEADGSYSLKSEALTVPGSAVVDFQVTQGSTREDLTGTLQVAGASPAPEEKNSARQLGWWVLNFAVCIGFLMLWTRRRKAAAKD
jgi:hypothetical protein